MKKLLTLTALVVLFASGAYAQRLQARFVTSAYAWQRQDTIGKSSQHLYGYETMQLSLAGEQLSLHTYLQGFNDFAGPLSNKPTLRLYNLYFKWANIGNMLDVSLGRQAVFAGVDWTGTYPIVCNEFCGIGHHTMLGKVFIAEGGK